ncbi:Uncharacterised protein [Vibrio cholerae]|nr:Uncharacterised protein [Vibrio cholerae]CSI56716.1 Uncharacterised protein [Vibrio cholerae]
MQTLNHTERQSITRAHNRLGLLSQHFIYQQISTFMMQLSGLVIRHNLMLNTPIEIGVEPLLTRGFVTWVDPNEGNIA